MDTNYEDMNDPQINKRVARVLGVEWVAVAQDGLILDGDSLSVDYCNNPSDAWPIIFENLIDVLSPTYKGHEWEATAFTKYDELVSSRDKNPLRAAMICFLKLKDVFDD